MEGGPLAVGAQANILLGGESKISLGPQTCVYIHVSIPLSVPSIMHSNYNQSVFYQIQWCDLLRIIIVSLEPRPSTQIFLQTAAKKNNLCERPGFEANIL